MRVAMLGDNCIDYYETYVTDDQTVVKDVKYPTGNVVDAGVNLQKLGVKTSIISTTGSDENGKMMLAALKKEGIDLSHFKVAKGSTAITYMSLINKDRQHKDYIEGVLENMIFDEEDIAFAAKHDFVHTALWGKAQGCLPKIKLKRNVPISFDYADRLDHQIVEETLPYVDYGFFSYHFGCDENIKSYLKDKVDRGMKVAVATFGEEGSLAYDGKNYIVCKCTPSTEVVNTVGAGDSYIAGFIYGLLHQKDILECMNIGSAIARQVVAVFEPWKDGKYDL